MCKTVNDFERSVSAASDLKNCTMVNCDCPEYEHPTSANVNNFALPAIGQILSRFDLVL